MTWTAEKNKRRCELIDKEFSSSRQISDEELEELDRLQIEMLAYRRKVAPLPIEEARHELEELEKKASQ